PLDRLDPAQRHAERIGKIRLATTEVLAQQVRDLVEPHHRVLVRDSRGRRLTPVRCRTSDNILIEDSRLQRPELLQRQLSCISLGPHPREDFVPFCEKCALLRWYPFPPRT